MLTLQDWIIYLLEIPKRFFIRLDSHNYWYLESSLKFRVDGLNYPIPEGRGFQLTA